MKATPPHALLVLLVAALLGAGPTLAQERKAKQAVDDRADTRAPADDVGKGTHFARKPLGPGAYFDDGNRAAVHKFFAAQPAKPASSRKRWQIGQSLAASAGAAVPPPLLASLPKLPPGHSYVQVGGDVLLIATGSRMVVDGIAAAPAR
jgi:Ni/Co efflux regulator RcnB